MSSWTFIPRWFSTLIAALSLFKIAQSALHVGLTRTLRFCLEWYDRAVGFLLDWSHPYLTKFIYTIAHYFDWHVSLQPHWKYIFIFILATSMSAVRASVNMHPRSTWKNPTRFVSWVLRFVFTMLFAALFIAVALGLMPIDVQTYSHNLVAFSKLWPDIVIAVFFVVVIALLAIAVMWKRIVGMSSEDKIELMETAGSVLLMCCVSLVTFLFLNFSVEACSPKGEPLTYLEAVNITFFSLLLFLTLTQLSAVIPTTIREAYASSEHNLLAIWARLRLLLRESYGFQIGGQMAKTLVGMFVLLAFNTGASMLGL